MNTWSPWATTAKCSPVPQWTASSFRSNRPASTGSTPAWQSPQTRRTRRTHTPIRSPHAARSISSEWIARPASLCGERGDPYHTIVYPGHTHRLRQLLALCHSRRRPASSRSTPNGQFSPRARIIVEQGLDDRPISPAAATCCYRMNQNAGPPSSREAAWWVPRRPLPVADETVVLRAGWPAPQGPLIGQSTRNGQNLPTRNASHAPRLHR
jgi:hypothetical protein